MSTCTYTKIKSDGYADIWKSECGYHIICEVPEEVGFSFAPKPNENGKFCPYCGKVIKLNESRSK